MTDIQIPAYVNPAVLEPGQIVSAVLDEAHTPLTVLRIEPLVVCRRPDGSEVTLFAHEVEVVA